MDQDNECDGECGKSDEICLRLYNAHVPAVEVG